MRPRILAHFYLASLLASAGATVAMLVALFIRYLPHSLLTRAGLACDMEDGCATPLPTWAGSTFSFLIGGMILGLVLYSVVAVCGQTSCSGRRKAELLGAAVPVRRHVPGGLCGRTWVLDDPAPFSCAIGFRRPAVLLTTGLLETFDDDEVDAVLAHEEGHVVARDNLIRLVAQTVALTFGFVPGVRTAYARLCAAQERAADEFAWERTGDGLLVAASLTKFARSLLAPGVPGVAGLSSAFADGGDVGERVRGLLADHRLVTCRRRVASVVCAFVIVATAFAGSALAFTDVTFAAGSPCPEVHGSTAAPQAGGAADASGAEAHEACADATH